MNARRGRSGNYGTLGPVLFIGLVGVLTLFNLRDFPDWAAGTDAGQPEFPAPHFTTDPAPGRDFEMLRFLRRMKADFGGWTLVGFDPVSVAFETAWGLPYVGPERTRVIDYRPDLSPEEYAALAPRISGRAAPYNQPAVAMIPPAGPAPEKIVVALRAPAGDTILFVPVGIAPDRIAKVIRGK